MGIRFKKQTRQPLGKRGAGGAIALIGLLLRFQAIITVTSFPLSPECSLLSSLCPSPSLCLFIYCFQNISGSNSNSVSSPHSPPFGESGYRPIQADLLPVSLLLLSGYPVCCPCSLTKAISSLTVLARSFYEGSPLPTAKIFQPLQNNPRLVLSCSACVSDSSSSPMSFYSVPLCTPSLH